MKHNTHSILDEDALRKESWSIHGKRVTFYLPGMFRIGDEKGLYPALSITGKACQLQCNHCKGRLVEKMIRCSVPEELLRVCLNLNEKGYPGCLVSGGSLSDGSLPWEKFLPALTEIKKRTALNISVHSGLVDRETASGFADARVDRVLIDVVGSDETLEEIFHLDCGVQRFEESLRYLMEYHLNVVPHVVVGIHQGQIRGEYQALDIIRRYDPQQLSIVVFMPLPGTPMAQLEPPDLTEVNQVILYTRKQFMDIPLSLGCGRPRGEYGLKLEKMAIDAGFNKIALWNDESIEYAENMGLEIEYAKTCCAV